MDDDALIALAEQTASALLSVHWEQPFGPEADVAKVGGKMFLLIGHSSGPSMVTLKVDPEDAEHLVQAFEELRPGYHMNKRHWITATAGPGLDADLIADLVKNSYELVGRSIPAARRPLLSEVRFSADEREPGQAG